MVSIPIADAPLICGHNFAHHHEGYYIRNLETKPETKGHRQHLHSISQLRGTFPRPITRSRQHDVRAAQIHLHSAYRVAVPVVLSKSEYPREPLSGLRHVTVYNMRKHCRGRRRTVIHIQTTMRIYPRSSSRFATTGSTRVSYDRALGGSEKRLSDQIERLSDRRRTPESKATETPPNGQVQLTPPKS
jgi:hypothetical protein